MSLRNVDDLADRNEIAVARRTIVRAAAWSIPVIAVSAAAPIATASVVPSNNARVTNVWYPAGANIPGYLDVTNGHSNYLSDANGQTWPLGFVTFVNDGSAPLPAGTLLTLRYYTTAFDPPAIRGNSVPGGISAPTYRTSGTTGYVDVMTLAPIAPGVSFSVDYTYRTHNAVAGVYTFGGIITPPTPFNDSNPADNSRISGQFGLGLRTDLQATGIWYPAGNNVPGYIGQSADKTYDQFHDNGTTWSPYVDWKNNGPGDLPAGTSLSFTYDANTFFDPTVTSTSVPGGVGSPVYGSPSGSPTDTRRTITVYTNQPIPSGSTFRVNYRIVAKNLSADSPVLTFSAIGGAGGDTNTANNSITSGRFQVVNR